MLRKLVAMAMVFQSKYLLSIFGVTLVEQTGLGYEVPLFCLKHLNNSASSDQEFNVLLIWLICVYPSDREEK